MTVVVLPDIELPSASYSAITTALPKKIPSLDYAVLLLQVSCLLSVDTVHIS
jgi:hypothetical protein